ESAKDGCAQNRKFTVMRFLEADGEHNADIYCRGMAAYGKSL
ncbi:hypothetical protein NPIL_283621, partial [Nephila pilipes]